VRCATPGFAIVPLQGTDMPFTPRRCAIPDCSHRLAQKKTKKSVQSCRVAVITLADGAFGQVVRMFGQVIKMTDAKKSMFIPC
jgi:hypothetical protein